MQCPRCGILASVRAERCPSCGLRFHVPVPSPVVESQKVAPVAVQYAAFWRRLGAFSIDSIFLGSLGGAFYEILTIIHRVNYGTRRLPNSWRDWLSVSASLMLLVFPAIMESSRYQATPGKLLSGIIVTDNHGRRIGFGRALLRNFLKILLMVSIVPSLTFLFIFIPGRKRGLHDMMTGCLVVMKEPKQVASIAVVPQPAPQASKGQAATEIMALPVQPGNKAADAQKTDEVWLYL